MSISLFVWLCPFQQFPYLASEIANLTSEIAIVAANQNISSEDFISDDVRQRLQDFTESGIAEINITQYQEQINAGIVNNTSLEEQLMVLQNLSNMFTANVSSNYWLTHTEWRKLCVQQPHFLCPSFSADVL